MAKQLLIEDNDIPVLREFYSEKRKQVLEELDRLDRLISQLVPAASPKTAPPPPPRIPIPQVNAYPAEGSYVDKIRYIIAKYGEATSSDIIDEILDNEPDKKRASLVATIGGKLSELYMIGMLSRGQNNKGIYLYKMK